MLTGFAAWAACKWLDKRHLLNKFDGNSSLTSFPMFKDLIELVFEMWSNLLKAEERTLLITYCINGIFCACFIYVCALGIKTGNQAWKNWVSRPFILWEDSQKQRLDFDHAICKIDWYPVINRNGASKLMLRLSEHASMEPYAFESASQALASVFVARREHFFNFLFKG